MMMRACAIAAALLAAGCQTVDLTPRSGYVVDATELTWKGVTLTAGDRVESTGRAGTFKPKDTGAEKDVNVVAGKTGVVLGGMKRNASVRVSETEPLQVALVRWDAQSWDAGGATLDLGEFEATIHVEYLKVVK